MRPLLIETTLTLFSGSTYVQYNIETGKRLTPNARPIAYEWVIPFRKIDAAMYWETNIVYFLSAMQVVRYKLDTKQVDAGYPKIIPFYWRGLWASDIDAILRIGQQTYFFRKNQYITYNTTTNQSSISSAQPIASYWNGLPERITGAVPILSDFVLFFSEEYCYIYNWQQKKTIAGPLLFTDVIQGGLPAFIQQISHLTT